jgi:hypothetical protein
VPFVSLKQQHQMLLISAFLWMIISSHCKGTSVRHLEQNRNCPHKLHCLDTWEGAAFHLPGGGTCRHCRSTGLRVGPGAADASISACPLPPSPTALPKAPLVPPGTLPA